MLAIDVANFLRRAWAVAEKKGAPREAAPTTLRMLARFLRARQPSHVVLAGEGTGSIRKALYPDYKSGRPPKPDGLVACEAYVAQALAGVGLPLIQVGGLEADDVLAGASMVATAMGLPAVLVTNDKDVEQLIDDTVPIVVWDGAERVLDEAAAAERWGVPSKRVVEVLAIAGDGDEAPGAKGLGPKRAAEILVAAGRRSLANLLADGGSWFVPEKYRAKFIEHRAAIALSYDLVRLRGAETAARIDLEDHAAEALAVASALVESAEWSGREY